MSSDYQEDLLRTGIQIPLSVSPEVKPDLLRVLDILEESGDSATSFLISTGRFSSDFTGDVLVLPDFDRAMIVKRALYLLAGDTKQGMRVRTQALWLEKAIDKATAGLGTAPSVSTMLGGCVRAETGVTADEVAAARRLVGTPAVKTRPRPEDPLVVSYGLGVDSTALLVGLARLWLEGRREFRPTFILFSDVGGEKEETYDYLARMNDWLARVGFPAVQVVGWATEHTAGGYGAARTLEQQCLINQTMPSISASKFQSSKCSVLWKQDTMNRWMELVSGLLEPVHGRGWLTRHGGKIVKAIGYDASPKELTRATKGTFRVDQELRSLKEKGREPVYEYWYPLQDWGWDRARCVAEIEAELGVAPPKSSCFFCAAMTRDEIAELPQDLLMRALLIEAVANRGRHADVQGWGLGVKDDRLRPNYWLDYARELGRVNDAELRELERQVEIVLAAAPEAKGTAYIGAQERMASLPAFSDVRGFRGRRLPMWDRYVEVLEESA
jgi:hypothetical protein